MKKQPKRRKRDDELAVLVVDGDDGPVAYTLPAELAPEARVPGINPVPARAPPSEKDSGARRQRLADLHARQQQRDERERQSLRAKHIRRLTPDRNLD
jgi:hypothetical protein